jgi:ABC-type branched-subunit amino acid transport system ATPase component
VLVATGMTKAYGGMTAVERASIQVRPGEIVGLMGPNGAGKSTLFGMIAGTISATSGQVILGGSSLGRTPSFRRSRRGIARTFQTNRLLLEQTVTENLMAAGMSARHGFSRYTPPERLSLEELLERSFLAGFPDARASELTVEQQRLLGVAMALATQPRVLLLDEPFAGLREVETPRLVSMLQRCRLAGVGIIIVEHKLKVLMALSDHVCVLDRGQLIAEGTPDEIMNHPDVIEAYLGSSHAAVD